MRAFFLFVLGGLALALMPGCSQPAQEARACTPGRAGWMRPTNFDGLTPPILRVSLDRAGAIHWGGQAIGLARLSHYLGIVHTMSPEPIVFLETEMGAPCAALDAVRDAIDRRMACTNHGHCAEGIMTVWTSLPTPPGTPVS